MALPILAMTDPTPEGPPGLEQVFREHQQRVFRAAYRVTGNAQDAEDVLQSVFLRLARREAGDLPATNLSNYLYRTAVNAAIDLLRTRRGPPTVDLEDAAQTLPDLRAEAPDQAHVAEELRAWLRRALARLGPKAAEVFTLRYIEEYDNQDIARMLGLSRVGVAVILHRTRRRLQRDLRASKKMMMRGIQS